MATRKAHTLLLVSNLLLLTTVAGEGAWILGQGPRMAQARAHADLMLREPDPSARRRGLSMYRAQDQWRMDAVDAVRMRQHPWFEAFILDEGLDPVTTTRLRQVLAATLAKQISRISIAELGSYTPQEAGRQVERAASNRLRVLQQILGDERGERLAALVDAELSAELALALPAAPASDPTSLAGD
jgi:hypothetical protein